MSLSETPKEYKSTSGGGAKKQTAKRWMITLNMHDLDGQAEKLSLQHFNAACQVHPCTYAVFQPEIGKNGTNHIQAYVEMASPLSLTSIKKHFGQRIHAEICKGTQAQCVDYCTKEDTRVPGAEPVTYGEAMKANPRTGGTQGSRSDWSDAWNRLKKGERVDQILDQHPHMLPCNRALTHARSAVLLAHTRRRKTKTTILYGDAGTGKSTTAYNLAKMQGDFYNLMPNGNGGLWFDGYDPLVHTTVVLDEFTGGKCKLTLLNMLMDEWPMQVETKGGTLPFLAKHLIICSNFHPSKWYDFENPEKHLCYPALRRRIDNLVSFKLKEEKTLGKVHTKTVTKIKVEIGIFPISVVKSPYPLRSIQIESAPSSPRRSLSPGPGEDPENPTNDLPSMDEEMELELGSTVPIQIDE